MEDRHTRLDYSRIFGKTVLIAAKPVKSQGRCKPSLTPVKPVETLQKFGSPVAANPVDGLL